MKKKYILLFTLICFYFSASSQVFQFHYGTAFDDDGFPMKKLPDGGFILAGSSKGNNAGGKDASLYRMNSLGQLQWSKQYGGSGDETVLFVERTNNGGYVACGETFSASANGDAFLFRTDSLGNLLWWKNYGGADYDINYSVAPLSDGGFILAGLTQSGPADYDAFLIRTDSNGDTLWTKNYGGPGVDHAVQVIQTSDGGFIFCGKMLSYGAGSCDCWLVKTDANGNLQWTKTYGGAGWDESMDIVERPDGYAVCGGSNSTGAGNYDFMLFKTDLSGNLQWTKLYGGGNIEASYCIIDVPGKGYAFCGYTETFGPGHNRGTDSANVWLIQTDYNGDTIRSMAYGGTLKEECFALDRTNSGGFALAGYTGSFGDSLQAYLFTTDSTGFAGCNEKRSYPDVTIANFVSASYAITLPPGIPVSTFAATTSALNAAGTQLCGGPLSENEIPQTDFSIRVFPNPSHENISISFGNEIAEDLQIFDAYGNCVFRSNPQSVMMQISTKDFAKGIYSVRAKNGKGAIANTVVVVE